MTIHEPIDDRHDTQRRVELTPTEARQGVLGRPVLAVLVIGLMLAMVAWAAAEFWGMSIDTQTPADTQQTTAPATENDNMVNDNPLPGDEHQTEPVLVNPQATGNQ